MPQTTEPVKEPTAPVVPDKYEFKAPDGVTYDTAVLDRATPLFKELKLDQASAQKLVDFQTELAKEWAKAQESRVTAMTDGWLADLKADKDIGSKLDEVSATIGRAKDRLPAELRGQFEETMNATKIGNHPAFVKAFYEFAKMATEGRPVTGSGPASTGQSKSGQNTKPTAAAALYPNLP